MTIIRPWETFREWHNRYQSDILHIQVPGQHIILLSTVEDAIELLERRSNIYSDRITPVMIELMEMHYNVALMPYSSTWRAHRRLFHQEFHPTDIDKYKATQLKQARNFLGWVSKSPAQSYLHTRRFVTAIILSIAYGRTITDMDDEQVVLVEKVALGSAVATLPGSFWVEFLPFLKYLPRWIPGQTFRKHADTYIPLVAAMRDKPFGEVQAAVDQGRAAPSLAQTLIEKARTMYGGTPEESTYLDLAKNVTAFAYAAAADTTASTSLFFLLAMALYPAVQKQAQAELDKVIGPNRLPDWDDLDRLPFLNAILMEVMRWTPVTPIGVPHAVSTDDEYKGYCIPNGSLVIPSFWTLMRNADDYPDPDAFKPERFLDKDGSIDPSVRDPTTIAFGFGRRICPGKYFAINNVLIFMATTLHVFDVSAGVDENGRPVELTTEMIGSVVAMPRCVPCGFTPRSKVAETLIHGVAA
ncbi:hypothetical protein EIP91_001597 [Steccherinum ochraceum]|uniref:Cytochrome P450 n=1 Tax=Steccherinum ochraceum TaxID=92696 RepID=A0A4R0RR10_9APHY|nr:hypothetical protein EIP91_001597 [Steccherinum ochraceum]